MNSAHRLATNTVIQIIGRGLTLIISVITLGFIANHLTVDGSRLEGYGQYSIVLTYISIIGATADLGLFNLVVREITGLPPVEAGRIVGSAIAFRVVLFLITLALLFVVLPFLPYEFVVKQGIVIGAVVAFLMLFSQAIAALFQATYQAEKIVIAEVTGRLLMMALTIYFLLQGYGLLPVIGANLIGNVFLLGLSYALSRRTAPIQINFDYRFWRRSLPQFWSIAAVTVLGLIHFRIDSLILSFYQPATEVGLYGVAYRILDIVLVIPAIIAANLLPVMTTLAGQENSGKLVGLITRMSGVLLAISVAIGAALFVLAPWVVHFITQADFVAAALPLRLLILAFISLFLTTLYSQTIIALREQRRLINGYLLVIALDIIVNLILIPKYSYRGAAITTVSSEIVLMVYSFWLLARLLPLRLRSLPWAKMLLFTAVAGGVAAGAYGIVEQLTTQFESYNKVIQGSWLLGIGLGIVAIYWLFFKLIFKTGFSAKEL